MFIERAQSKRITEASLIVVCGGLTFLLYIAVGHKLVVLNLFYLPIVLSAFYLGRHRAGLLTFFSILLATMVATADLDSFLGEPSKLMIGVSLIVWAGVMGLNALFVGTLSDERRHKIEELHDAYLGVVEVLAQYLKGADPSMIDRTKRITVVTGDVAQMMRLSDRECDDIRVAALLQDIDNIEVTARVINRAVDDLQNSEVIESNTFHGGDLIQSLGRVLTSALPLLACRSDGLDVSLDNEPEERVEPIGAAIIRAVRRYDDLTAHGEHALEPVEAIESMRSELDGDYHTGVLAILEQLTERPSHAMGGEVRSIESLASHSY